MGNRKLIVTFSFNLMLQLSQSVAHIDLAYVSKLYLPVNHLPHTNF